jgi:hypothetical protein
MGVEQSSHLGLKLLAELAPGRVHDNNGVVSPLGQLLGIGLGKLGNLQAGEESQTCNLNPRCRRPALIFSAWQSQHKAMCLANQQRRQTRTCPWLLHHCLNQALRKERRCFKSVAQYRVEASVYLAAINPEVAIKSLLGAGNVDAALGLGGAVLVSEADETPLALRVVVEPLGLLALKLVVDKLDRAIEGNGDLVARE